MLNMSKLVRPLPVPWMPRLPRGLWLGILAAMAAGIILALMFTVLAGGTSVTSDTAVSVPSSSAPASGPPASVNTKKNSALPSTQETAPATEQAPAAISPQTSSQPVFLPMESNEAKEASSPFVGIGTYTEQTFEEIRPQDRKNWALDGGPSIAALFFIFGEQDPMDILFNAERLAKQSPLIANPGVVKTLAFHFREDRTSLQAVTIEPSMKEGRVPIPSQGLWLCVTTHQGWTPGQTHQTTFAIQGIYGIEEGAGDKVWSITEAMLAGGSSAYC